LEDFNPKGFKFQWPYLSILKGNILTVWKFSGNKVEYYLPQHRTLESLSIGPFGVYILVKSSSGHEVWMSPAGQNFEKVFEYDL
jgi:hypothetical protein